MAKNLMTLDVVAGDPLNAAVDVLLVSSDDLHTVKTLRNYLSKRPSAAYDLAEFPRLEEVVDAYSKKVVLAHLSDKYREMMEIINSFKKFIDCTGTGQKILIGIKIFKNEELSEIFPLFAMAFNHSDGCAYNLKVFTSPVLVEAVNRAIYQSSTLMPPELPFLKENQALAYSSFRCQKCRNFPINARTCSNCLALFCSTCEDNCLNCAMLPYTYLEDNKFVQIAIDQFKEKCICGVTYPVNDKSTHQTNCVVSYMKCPVHSCPFEGTQNMYVNHILESHRDTVLTKVNEILNAPLQGTVERNYECGWCGSHSHVPDGATVFCRVCNKAP